MIIQNIIYVEISLSGRSVREEELVSVYRSHHIIRPHGLREVKPCGFESEDLPSLEGWTVTCHTGHLAGRTSNQRNSSWLTAGCSASGLDCGQWCHQPTNTRPALCNFIYCNIGKLSNRFSDSAFASLSFISKPGPHLFLT